MPRALEDAGSSTLGVTWCRCQNLVTWSLGHLQVLPWWDEWRLRPWWNSNAHRCCLDRGDTGWHMVTLDSDASCNFQSHSSPEIQKISHQPVKKWQENHKISQNHWLTVQSNSGFAAWIVQSRCLPQIWHGNLTLTGSQLTQLTRLTQLTQWTLTQVHVLGRDWNRHRIWWHWRHWSEGLGLSLRIYLARQRISCSTIGPACTDTLQNRTVITCSSSVSVSSEKTICKDAKEKTQPKQWKWLGKPARFATGSPDFLPHFQLPHFRWPESRTSKNQRNVAGENEKKKTIENAVPAHATNLTSWQVPPKASHFNVKGLAKWNQKFPQMTSWWVVLSKSQCWKLKECEGKRYERREITRVEKNVRSCEILWGEMQRAPVEVEASERAVWPRCSWQKCPEPPIVLHLTDLTQLTQLPQLTQFRFSRLLFLVVSREPEKTNNEQRLAT